MPAALASSMAYWMTGLSTTGSISFGIALVAGRKRVPRPATGKIALRMGFMRDGAENTAVGRNFDGHFRGQIGIIAATSAPQRSRCHSGAFRAEYYKFDALSLRQPKS